MKISHTDAQKLMVAALGLDRRPPRAAQKADLLNTIRRMGALQIDTINVVARSPYVVLWSRLGDYPLKWLEELLAERALFEYWSHEACFLPIEDYPLYRHSMINPETMGWKFSQEIFEGHRGQIERLLAHIRAQGPVRSADFVRTDGKGGGWWGWKPEKRLLEILLTAGELMIARRHNFQRIYDLRERVLPDWHDSRLPELSEVRKQKVLKAVRALGIARAGWVADYFRTNKKETAPLPAALARAGELIEVTVSGWSEPAYLHPDNLKLARAVMNGHGPELTTLLSPFDPLVWDRARLKAVFDFDYKIECYTPEPKRVYGYFTLPILYRGALIGRLDPKAHRKERLFEVKSIHLEKGVKATDEMIAAVAGAIREFAHWHNTPEIVVRSSSPRGLAKPLQRAITVSEGGHRNPKNGQGKPPG